MEMLMSCASALGMASSSSMENKPALTFQVIITMSLLLGIGLLFGYLALSTAFSFIYFNYSWRRVSSFRVMLDFLMTMSSRRGWNDRKSGGGGGNDGLAKGEVEMVLEKLGIFSEENMKIMGLGEKGVGVGEFESIFDEKEPSLEEVKEAFEVFDEDRDGFIDAGELEKVLGALGYSFLNLHRVDCQRMIMNFDADGDGRLDFGEFVKLLEKSLHFDF